MELAEHTSRPGTQPLLGRILLITHLAVLGLLVVGSLSSTVAFLALRADEVPAFDWQLTLDGQHGLALHYGPVCMQVPGVPTGACADYVPEVREFSVSYYTPDTHQQLVSALVPVR